MNTSSPSHFPRLFQPGSIGKLRLRNRIMMAPMGTGYEDDDGTAGRRLIDYFRVRSGGVGLVIAGVAFLGPGGGLKLDGDEFISPLRSLVDAIHRGGTGACLQLGHLGAVAAIYPRASDLPPVAPSPVPLYAGGPVPKELTGAEIEGLVESFALAAGRARKAGFDCVELHGAHGYLISQFLSPLFNKREDEYGGEVRGRARFLLDIISAVRSKCGGDFPILVRLNGEEYEAGGVKIEDTKALAGLLEDAGADALHISYGTQTSPEPLAIAPSCHPQGLLVPLASEIKEAVDIPVITVGRIRSPYFAEEVIAEGKADFVALGRALLADPHWAEKAGKGEIEDIRPCIGCNSCVQGALAEGQGLRCAVNPELGREEEYEIKRTARPKKVVVVGGGPAGMEAGRVTALRGHRVTLYEKGPRLGGQLLAASRPPHKAEIEELTRHLATQLGKLGIELKLETEFTSDEAESSKPDTLILATGASPSLPDIPGVDRENVLTAEEVLLGRETGKRVAVIGGELVGCETAEYLAEGGREVVIMRRGRKMATNLGPVVRALLLRRLRQRGVRMITGVSSYREITADGISFVNSQGAEELIAADTVVLASGTAPNDNLLRELKGKVAEAYAIGDCAGPKNLLNAIHEGADIARRI
ncbi:FAD-dependent oxidoreductase [Chloroflexota bacterium]